MSWSVKAFWCQICILGPIICQKLKPLTVKKCLLRALFCTHFTFFSVQSTMYYWGPYLCMTCKPFKRAEMHFLRKKILCFYPFYSLWGITKKRGQKNPLSKYIKMWAKVNFEFLRNYKKNPLSKYIKIWAKKSTYENVENVNFCVWTRFSFWHFWLIEMWKPWNPRSWKTRGEIGKVFQAFIELTLISSFPLTHSCNVMMKWNGPFS